VIEGKQIIEGLIYMTDFLFPTLSPAEQSVVMQIFSRTWAVGEDSCRLSCGDLARLTGMTTLTLRKAIKRLTQKGVLISLSEHKPKVARSYKLHIPKNIPQSLKIQRNPYLICNPEKEETTEKYKLSPEGKGLVEVIKNSLSSSELSDIYRLANEEMSEGESLESVVESIIVRRYFSDEKKRKFLLFNQRI
jgi:hypothetical protein